MSLEVTDSNFAEILEQNNLTMIQFSAPWCGPCKMLSPIVEQLSEENKDFTIGKVNIDDNMESAAKYGIRGVPTLLFFKNGEVIDKIVGVKSKGELQEKINSLKA